MLLARLRWSAFGLRGRIVGAVVVTAAISLGVAALVLLPQLEHSLKHASQETLIHEVDGAVGDIATIASIPYQLIPEAQSAPRHSRAARRREALFDRASAPDRRPQSTTRRDQRHADR